MDENFCKVFGEETKKLINSSYTPLGAEIMNKLKNTIETCLDKNNISFYSSQEPWNGYSGSLSISLNILSDKNQLSDKFTKIYSMSVRIIKGNLFALKGMNVICPEKNFRVQKNYDEINLDLITKLILQLVQ